MYYDKKSLKTTYKLTFNTLYFELDPWNWPKSWVWALLLIILGIFQN